MGGRMSEGGKMAENDYSTRMREMEERIRSFRSGLAATPEGIAEVLSELEVALEELEAGQEQILVQVEALSTASKQIEQERQRYIDLFNFAPDGYIVTDLSGHIKEVNSAAGLLLNRSAHLLYGKPICVLVEESIRADFRRIVFLLPQYTYRCSGEVLITRAQQPPFVAEVSVSVMCDNGGEPQDLLWMIRDITQRKQMNAELRRHEMEFRALAENSPDLIGRVDRNLRYLYANPAAERAMGFPSGAYTGKTPRESGMNEEVASQWETAIQKVFDTRSEETIEFALPFAGEMKYYRLCLAPEFEPDNTMQTVLWIAHDNTERHNADQLRDNIISLVSHELRTPLTLIKGYSSSLLQAEVSWDQDVTLDFIQTIDRAADRLSRLIEDILEMSRLQSGGIPLRRETAFPSTLVQSAVKQASPLLEDRQVSLHLPPDLPEVFIDPRRIEQVIINLLQNAARYSPDGSHVSLEAAASAGEVVFSVADNGEGIAPEYHEAIFQRFTRIQPQDRPQAAGTGLGLAISKAIVEAHGGRIWVESEPGQGSTFRFTVPIGG
jgi:NtrC-family two-component system sensor histidine kinase KinB